MIWNDKTWTLRSAKFQWWLSECLELERHLRWTLPLPSYGAAMPCHFSGTSVMWQTPSFAISALNPNPGALMKPLPSTQMNYSNLKLDLPSCHDLKPELGWMKNISLCCNLLQSLRYCVSKSLPNVYRHDWTHLDLYHIYLHTKLMYVM